MTGFIVFSLYGRALRARYNLPIYGYFTKEASRLREAETAMGIIQR